MASSNILGLDCDFKSFLLEGMFHRIGIDAHSIETRKNYTISR